MAAATGADEGFYHAQCQYYCRERYYRAMQLTASEAMKKFGQGPAFRFWYSLSLAMEGKLQEAIRELENTMNDSDLQLATVLASMYCHQLCQSVDREAVQALDTKRREGRKKAGDRALYYAGMVLVLTGHPEKAREYLDRSLKLNAESVDSWVMRGWVEMYAGENPTKAIEYLDQAAKRNGRDISLLFCRARYYELHNDFASAQTELNQVVAMRPGFVPPLVEKMKVSMAMLDWEQSLEMMNRILTTAPHSIEALRFRLIGLLTRDGNYTEATKRLEEFVRNVDRHEPHNPPFLLECARLFSRTCGRNADVLEFTLGLAEKAAQLEPTRAEYLVEVGYQHLLKNNIREALKYYKAATKQDEASMEALSGIITCQLIDGDHQTAEQSLEFLKETQRSLGYTADILYLSALLARKQNKSPDEVLGLLNDAIETHFRSFRTLSLGVPYLIALNPDFLVLLVKDCLHYAPTQPVALGSTVPAALKRAMMVLEPVTKCCPGLLEALYLMAKAKYLSGDDKMAASTLKHCIDDVDQSYADAHILNAQIQLHQGFFKQASQSLELGLSYNFEIKDHPLFHLIKARVQKRENQIQDAIQTLHTAIQLAGLSSKLVKGSTPKSKIDVNANDQVSIYLELTDAYRMAGQESDAHQIMEEATLMFKGTGEEVRILVANADLLLARNEISGALGSLRNVAPDQPYYLQSRHKMAQIYFDYLKDRRMYAAMFKEIVDQIPTPASYLMLGDAYMTILEPDKAIEVYESALKRNPRDHDLALKMGRALVKTHNYGKAINYYKEAIKVGEDDNLRYDMAELQMRMRQYDKAEKTIQQALEKIKSDNVNNLASMIMQAQLLKLMAKVHDLVGDINKSIKTLQDANELQVRVLKRVQMEQPDSVAEHRSRATEICCTMSERYQSQRNYEQAIKFYREALQHQPDDAPALLALARLYMQTDDLDQCQYTCMTLLRQDKENDLATVMMADLSFRRNDYETAMFHFQELLTRRPDYFAALARLIEVMRRTGHLEKVPDYLDKAEKASTRGTTEAGLAFCRALYEWYSSNPNGALKYFNQARRDPEWGQRAVYHMINICLNPDNMTIGGETFEAMDDLADPDIKSSQEMALRTAEKLLQELKPKPGDQAISHQLLTNFLLIASKNKGNMERALQEFTAIASSETYKDHVGAICGMATAYMLLKQTPRARNQLKRVAKNTWNFEDAEYLERCWLLLADIYIQSGKYDLAQDVIQRILHNNRSCGKAHEYAGFIHEKESSYKDAADNYEMSWRFSRRSNPVIGFKLAFNYLKAKRYVDAIDVCHQVMEKFPDYPKIRKEILDKSRAQLKI